MGHPGLGDLTEGRYTCRNCWRNSSGTATGVMVLIFFFLSSYFPENFFWIAYNRFDMPIHLTRSVKALVVACVVVFLVQKTGDLYFHTDLLSVLGLVPDLFFQQGRYWQVFTYSFVHGDVLHLFFDLLMLAFIGSEIEMTWGRSQFLKYYFFCSISAGFAYLLVRFLGVGGIGGSGVSVPMIGCSGAIYGLLMAYGLIFGERVLLFMMLFPLKAKHFIWVLAAVELMTTIYSSGGPVASFAHLTGMGAGFLYLWGRARWIVHQRDGTKNGPSRYKRKKSKHLKLVVNPSKEGVGSSEDQGGVNNKGNPTIWN